MLEVESLCLDWRGTPVLEEVSFTLAPGETLLLTGCNGSGKSSLIDALAGLSSVQRGHVVWEGQTVTHLPAYRRPGIALVPEGRVLAPSLTIDETLTLGAGRIPRATLSRVRTEIFDRFPILAKRRTQYAGTLSGGEAQMLSLARALMSRPRLLLLDEPTLGLSPAAAKDTFALLHALRANGMGMILTDQDSRAALALADRICTLANRRLKDPSFPSQTNQRESA